MAAQVTRRRLAAFLAAASLVAAPSAALAQPCGTDASGTNSVAAVDPTQHCAPASLTDTDMSGDATMCLTQANMFFLAVWANTAMRLADTTGGCVFTARAAPAASATTACRSSCSSSAWTDRAARMG